LKILALTKTAALREMYQTTKKERPDEPLVVELCDAGLALLDAEVAYSDAPTPQNEEAVAQAKQRSMTAYRALDTEIKST